MKKLILLIVLAFSLNINAQVKDSTKVDNFQNTDQVLSKIVEKALVVAEKTGNFVIEQTPLLLQEFYNWHIVGSILGILMGIIIFLLGRYIPNLWIIYNESQGKHSEKYFNKYTKNCNWDNGILFARILFAFGLIISSIMFMINLYNLLFILIAPKLYLINYFIR